MTMFHEGTPGGAPAPTNEGATNDRDATVQSIATAMATLSPDDLRQLHDSLLAAPATGHGTMAGAPSAPLPQDGILTGSAPPSSSDTGPNAHGPSFAAADGTLWPVPSSADPSHPLLPPSPTRAPHPTPHAAAPPPPAATASLPLAEWIQRARSSLSRESYVAYAVIAARELTHRLCDVVGTPTTASAPLFEGESAHGHGLLLPPPLAEQESSGTFSTSLFVARIEDAVTENVTVSILADADPPHGNGEATTLRPVHVDLHPAESKPRDVFEAPPPSAGDACLALGTMLFELFSQGDPVLLLDLEGDALLPDEGRAALAENDDACGEVKLLVERLALARPDLPSAAAPSSAAAPPRRSRKAKAHLRERGMPASVARLVADLLAAGEDDGRASATALVSLEEAHFDLTRMQDDPERFLHDGPSPRRALDSSEAWCDPTAGELVHGREKELALLTEAAALVAAHVHRLPHVARPSDAFLCEAVVLTGPPGGGKSTLASAAAAHCAKDGWSLLDCRFAQGTAPLAAWVRSFDAFFAQFVLAEGGDGRRRERSTDAQATFDRMSASIIASIDGESFGQLCDLLPSIGRLFPMSVNYVAQASAGHPSSAGAGLGSDRLHRLFHILFKAVCSAGPPVAMVLEDLQWADALTLGLIVDLIGCIPNISAPEDTVQGGLLLVGTVRDTAADDEGFVMDCIGSLGQPARNINVTTLRMGELTERDVHRMLSFRLGLPLRYTRELARLVHREAGGVPLSVMEFLRSRCSLAGTSSTAPRDADVLFGRGGAIMAHPGNENLRTIVGARRDEFLQTPRQQKRDIAYAIVDAIERAGGRFLMEDPECHRHNASTSLIPDKVWICVDREKAVDKVMHRLRVKVGKESKEAEADRQSPHDVKSSVAPLSSDNTLRNIEAPQPTSKGTAELGLFFVEAANAERFPMSLGEFIRSGYLSSSIALARDDGGGIVDVENAARMALVLTRVLIGHLSDLCVESIELDDVVVCAEQDGNNGLTIGLDSLASAREDPNRALLLRMDIVARTGAGSAALSAMPTLGRLLYSIFSLGIQSLPPGIARKAAQPSSEAVVSDALAPISLEEELVEHYSKSARSSSDSVFSRLLECGLFSASICRLLSDLFNAGDYSEGDSPFASFDDVLRDLEQMVSQPQTFLHDHGPHDSPLLFGKADYGRKEEVATITRAANRVADRNNSLVEAVFISGIGGSGKSHLVKGVADHLSSSGWVVIKSKFKHGMEHTSRTVVSDMFEELVSDLVTMKQSGEKSDVEYSTRASKFIFDAIGHENLASLANFLPSLTELFGDMSVHDAEAQADVVQWKLIYSFSKILEAVLEPDRRLMLCCDDLQWSDKSTLALISEVLFNVGDFESSRRNMLFVGLYREDEVDDDHPLAIQYSYLQMSSIINTVEVKLSSLSKEDVTDMLMSELRLPGRLVRGLADIVHKKTSGHAIFVVELLNSLVRESAIAYSPRKHRYDWDEDRIDMIRTGESVAELIASNVSSLPASSQRVLRVLSCFGIQTDLSLLQLLEKFHEGILCDLDSFLEKGILDRAGPIYIFTHDLIQQGVYESMSLGERQALHLELGRFLGERADAQCPSQEDSLTRGINELQLDDLPFYVGSSSLTSSLIDVACDQINAAGLDAAVEDSQRVQFARWNLSGGKESLKRVKFRAAARLFAKGIAFLPGNCWLSEAQLSLALYEGAMFASLALGNGDDVLRLDDIVTKHASFEDSLEAQEIALRSLSRSERHEECISRGLGILHRLDSDIPSELTPEIVTSAMASMDDPKLSKDQLMDLYRRDVDDQTRRVFKVMDSVILSCFAARNDLLPYLASTFVQYSLQNGVTPESTNAFAMYAMLRVFSAGGQFWEDAARDMVSRLGTNSSNSGWARMILDGIIDMWYKSARDNARNLLKFHDECVRSGDLHFAAIAFTFSFECSLYGGEKLSWLLKAGKKRLKRLSKHSREVTKYMVAGFYLACELTGESSDHYFSEAFGDSIRNMNDLIADARSTQNDYLMYQIDCIELFVAFWRGDYASAEEHCHNTLVMIPETEVISVVHLYQVFFGGLTWFKLAGTRDCKRAEDDRDQRLQKGKGMMDKVGKWAQKSMEVFGNKWLLLRAEYSTCMGECDEARQLYEDSIRSAMDHGNIHEAALAQELLGDYYASRGNTSRASESYSYAYALHKQWGATGVAEKLVQKHGLDASEAGGSVASSKRSR